MSAWIVTPICTALLGACGTGWQRQGIPDPAVPGAYATAEDRPVSALDSDWYRLFGSSELDSAIDNVRESNLGLAQARDRVRQAQAAMAAARAGRLPVLDASVSAGRARQQTPFGAEQSNAFGASLSAGYEVDLWGRVAATNDASELEAAALVVDVSAIEVTLTATATEAWLDAVHARAKRVLLREQIEVQDEFLELLLHRLSAATATALDVEQQRQQLASLEGQLALLDASEARAGHTFSFLQGQFPDPSSTGEESELPELPSLPEAGVPADLLQRRPDVVAARIRAEAADARLAAAVAARLPSLRLNGSTFVQSSSLSALFDEILWSVTAGLTAPLFDGGRRAAEVERNDAVLDERIHAYLETLLEAAVEVENAVALERAQSAYREELDDQLRIAEATLALARAQYREGVTDYVRVLTAISTLQRLQQMRLDATRQQLGYRIQLYRALGGGWSRPEST